MAILNSITIGKGRKSLGNVTLQTLGGVVVAKQKIMRNTSKTVKQQKQRKHFKQVMNQLRKFAPLARLAYSRVKTSSAYARFASVFYPAAAELTPQQLKQANPITLAQSMIAAGEDFMLVEGNKVFSSVRFFDAGTENVFANFYLTSELPGAKPFGVGDTVPVDVYAFNGETGEINLGSFPVVVGNSQSVKPENPALNIYNGALVLTISGINPAPNMTDYLVISINNERIGLRAQDFTTNA